MMNWKNRYATTQKSVRELKAILPEGWQHVGFTQPDGNRPVKEFTKWTPPQQKGEFMGGDSHPLEPLPNARRNRIKTPDVHMVMNPTTGNTAEIYDHSGMNEDARSAYWNPVDHGKLIANGLKRLDSLSTGTNLRMLRHKANRGNMMMDPVICSAQDAKNVDIGAPDESFVGPKFEILDHELGHVRHNRDPKSLAKFASVITDHYNSDKKPRDQVDPGWVDSHMAKCLDYSGEGKHDHSQLYSNDFTPWGKMPAFLNKVVKGTATSDYGASSLSESYACHHDDYLNGSTNPLTQRLGKELGWDKPI
jgi:hypothetical protein